MYIGRPANFAPVVNSAAEIADLPWFGNFGSDSPLFQAIDEFIFERCTSAEEAIQALNLMGRHGMGLDDVVTLATLRQYCEEAEQTPACFTL